MDLIELVEMIRSDLETDTDTSTTLRLVRQFIMDMRDPDHFETVVDDEPPSTGDERWDAMIAGVVEYLAFDHGRKVPAWTVREPLERWWFVTSVPELEPTAFVETPPALAHRGVFIRRASLVNV